MMPLNFIGGTWAQSASGRTAAVVNPFRPSAVMNRFPLSDATDVDRAVAAAAAAGPAWRKVPGPQRGGVLYRAAELLQQQADGIARVMAAEVGKPVREGTGEVQRAVELLRYFAGEGWRATGEVFDQSARSGSISVLHRPVGVVGLLTPWNFPLSIVAWKAAPALIYGNSVVVKVANECPSPALYLAAALHSAGLPAGVFNAVIGDGPEAGAALVEHPDVAAVSFTGSEAVGREVLRQASLRGCKVQLEMGGHSSLIVAPDADVDKASAAAALGAYWSAGQKCTSTRRVYVVDSLYCSFRDALLEQMSALCCGDPLDQRVVVGPLAGARQLQGVTGAIERGLAEGASLTRGGVVDESLGYFVAPALFEEVGDEAFLTRNEVFGPVCALYRCADVAEAIERSNANPYGLSASIFTNDVRTTALATAELQAGVIRINSPTVGGEPHVAFGGVKASGYGPREQGRAAREFFTETVTVYQSAEVAS